MNEEGRAARLRRGLSRLSPRSGSEACPEPVEEAPLEGLHAGAASGCVNGPVSLPAPTSLRDAALSALVARSRGTPDDAVVIPEDAGLGRRRTFVREATPVLALERDARVAQLKQLLGAFMERSRAPRVRPAAAPLCPVVAPAIGRALDSAGFARLITQHLEPAHCHGRSPVGGALSMDGPTVAAVTRDVRLLGFDPRSMLILDTETTGLAGGTGTLPFLIGLARFEDESLALEQLLVCRPGHEAPALEVLASRLRSASALVTYNGKSFDWPILAARFVMNRISPPPCPPHLDLLHVARRVYRARLESAKLVRVEESVLGFVRHDDVAGAAIPQLYWSFVREGDPRALDKVLEHNVFDVVALAALLGELATSYRQPRPTQDPRDLLGLGELAFESGDYRRALDFAALAGTDPTLEFTSKRLAARCGAKLGMYREASEWLAEATELASDDAERAEASLTLAKLLEHKLKDLGRALLAARQAGPEEGAERNEARVRRLSAKLERAHKKELKRRAKQAMREGVPSLNGAPSSDTKRVSREGGIREQEETAFAALQ